MTTPSRPLRVVEVEGVGWMRWPATRWELQDADGNLLADIEDYRTFMQAWMDAPLGLFEVVPLEEDRATDRTRD